MFEGRRYLIVRPEVVHGILSASYSDFRVKVKVVPVVASGKGLLGEDGDM
jgi:hypothetical protein